MKLQVLIDLNSEPDEVIGIVPFRDKIIIATRNRLLMLEHDKETEIKITELIQRHHNDLWSGI